MNSLRSELDPSSRTNAPTVRLIRAYSPSHSAPGWGHCGTAGDKVTSRLRRSLCGGCGCWIADSLVWKRAFACVNRTALPLRTVSAQRERRRWFTHTPTHSLTHSRTHSRTHALTHARTHSLIQTPTATAFVREFIRFSFFVLSRSPVGNEESGERKKRRKVKKVKLCMYLQLTFSCFTTLCRR